ncbi:MAG: hypothetical protein JJ863_08365 [Deltaproteobacteria bacterium]|nr:hypothetical protein [Deltaproteobacteria bacterium]
MRAASLAILAICSFGCARSFEVEPALELDAAVPDSCAIPAPAPVPSAGCPAVDARSLVVVRGSVTADQTWSCDHRYVLEGDVLVEGATLTIEAGVSVRSEGGSLASSTGRIEALGTATDPVVFQGVAIALLGRAPIDAPDGVSTLEGRPYGGVDTTHDCGTLRHVRIEQSALTLAGCGAHTEVDFVQVHGSPGDGLSIRGGTVSVAHVVSTDSAEQGIDWSEGWRGDGQFIIVRQAPSGGAALEGSSRPELPDDARRSAPRLWNTTLVGQSDHHAMHFHGGTAGSIHNAIVTSFSARCVRLHGLDAVEQANVGKLVLTENLLNDCGGELFEVDDPDDASVTFTGEWATRNTFDVDPALPGATHPTRPDFRPAARSIAAELGVAPSEGLDSRAAFLGAIEPDCWDWTAGWTAYR